jgi:hypothetical protein
MRKLPDAVTIATAGRSPGAVTDAIVEHFRQVTVGGATVDASAFPALGEKSIIGDLSAASP